MSASLRSQIRLAVTRLQALHQEDNTFEWQAEAEQSDAENLERLEAVADRVDMRLRQVEGQIDKAERAMDEYTTIISKSTAAERPNETAMFETFLAEQDIEAALERASDFMTKLQDKGMKWKAEIKKRQSKAEVKLPVQQTNSPASSVHLPSLLLNKFKGQRSEWREFWELFCIAVHDNTRMSDVEKMTYLRSLLEDEAKDVIAGLPIQKENYKAAIDLLSAKYNNKDAVIRELHQQLVSFKPCQSLKDCQKFLLSLDKTVRQLKSIGQEVEVPAIWLSLEQKLTHKGTPKNLLKQILEKRADDKHWNTTKFVATLSNLIEKEETLQGICSLSFTEKEDTQKKKWVKKEESQAYSSQEVEETNPETLKSKNSSKKKNKKEGNSKAESSSANSNWVNSTQSSDFQPPPQGSYFTPLPSQKGATAGANTGATRLFPCWMCNGPHWPSDCDQNSTGEQRKIKAVQLNRCLNCCRPGHAARDCGAPKKVCYYCRQDHNRLFCTIQDGLQVSSNSTLVSGSTTNQSKVALFMCAAVTTANPENLGLREQTYLAFDTMSHKTFVAEEVKEQLKLKNEPKDEFKLWGINDKGRGPTTYSTNKVEIYIQRKDKGYITITPTVMKECVPTPTRMALLTPESLEALKKETLSLPVSTQKPDLLIGVDQYDLFEIQVLRRLPSGFMLLDSAVGYLIRGEGQLQCESYSIVQGMPALPHIPTQEDEEEEASMKESMAKFFSLEAAGLADLEDHSEADEVMANFRENLVFCDGRYQVNLPWIKPLPSLPCNYGLALGRLQSLMRSLKKKPERLHLYEQTLKEQFNSGIIEEVKNTENATGPVHYLPHQAVFKENKSTTRLRIVFDASSKSNTQFRALNECLHKGPLMLNELTGVLLRFRSSQIAIIADIEKAFLQISIKEEDRDATRFLWPEDTQSFEKTGLLKTFRFTRVAFGLAPSPFLLAATITEHLKKEGSELAKQIIDDIYVDNINLSAENSSEVVSICHQAKKMFQAAGFNLREFASNAKEEIDKLNQKDRLTEDRVKVLGIGWHTGTDLLEIKLPNPKLEKKCTKRSILSTVASLFDPIGLVGPVLVPLKLFLQKLWDRNLGWDEEVDDLTESAWKNVVSAWEEERDFKIPRRLWSRKLSDQKFEVHCFTDASGDAFGAAIYIRTIQGKDIDCNLAFSKNRLVPTTTKKKKREKDSTINKEAAEVTIPKLELHALALGVKMLEAVVRELRVPIAHTQCWPDSQCIIGWLNSREKMRRFIQNRVVKIRPYAVSHVGTKQNPADLASRGCSYDQLVNNELWFKGPSWLRIPKEEWPPSECFYSPASNIEQTEENEELPEVTVNTTEERPAPLIQVGKWSKWSKAKKTTAFVLRFLKKKVLSNSNPTSQFLKEVKETQTTTWLNASELKVAENYLLRQMQNSYTLKENVLQELQIFKDKQGLLRLNSRLNNSELDDEAKQPIYLPKDSVEAALITQEVHERNHHSAVNTTTALLRQKFWMPRGKRSVAAILRKTCVKCSRLRVQPYSLPPPPDLPTNRVKACRPFLNVGVDYFGPLRIKLEADPESRKKQEPKKVWVSLYTCMVTRAIHLEIAQDCSAEMFLHTFRRFLARRGTPESVTSDNGTNFVAAAASISKVWPAKVPKQGEAEIVARRQLRKAYEVQTFAANHGITWNFIPERAAWFGGFYEAMVKCVKQSMQKTVGRSTLCAESLHTLLTEIEGIVNSRPLTAILEGEFTRILRPVDFLIPYEANPVNTDLPLCGEEDDEWRPKQTTRDKLEDMIKKAAGKLDKFWTEFSQIYLTELRETHRKIKSETSPVAPMVGEDVLVLENDSPRSQWRTGRITQLNRSADGRIRSAMLKMGKDVKEWRRAINHLYPLEIRDTPQKDTPQSAGKTKPVENNEPLICNLVMEMDELVLDYDEFVELAKEEQVEDKKNASSIESAAKQILPTIPLHSKPRARDPFTNKLKSQVVVPSQSNSKPGLCRHRSRSPRSRSSASKNNQNVEVTKIKSAQPQHNLLIINGKMLISDITSTGWEWAKQCDQNGKHRECRPVTLWHVLSTIRPPRKRQTVGCIERLIAPTILHVVVTRWALRQHNLELAIRMTKEAVQLPAMRLAVLVEDYAPRLRECEENSGAQITEKDVTHSLDVWRNCCEVAFASFQEETWAAVKTMLTPPPARHQETQEKFVNLAIRLGLSLTKMRCRQHYPNASLVNTKVVIIGDSVAKKYAENNRGHFKEVTATENLKEEVQNSVYLGNSTEALMVWIGRDWIRSGEQSKKIIEQISELIQWLRRYEDVQVALVAPPLVPARQTTWKEVKYGLTVDSNG